MPNAPLKKSEIKRILKRHRGSLIELGSRCKPPVSGNAVSMWLGGGPNSNVAAHAEAYARELLAREEADRLTKGEANGPSARKLINEVLTKGVDDPDVRSALEKLKKKSTPTEEQ